MIQVLNFTETEDKLEAQPLIRHKFEFSLVN